jgi:large subunit ribosomal protein L17
VQHILTVVGPKFADRDGGYTRIIKIGKRRLGDGTDLVLLQLVGEEEGPQLGGGESRRRVQKQRRRDFAAKVFVATAPVTEVAEAVSEDSPEDGAEDSSEEIIDETLNEEKSEEVTEVTEVPEAPESTSEEE